ncbi:AI-2E family transporter [Algicola sagamiensis]|uniref:AI-2E family transporter n=1 Tax=Algicola sagamiensis TaxID=163869 RepID=UPI00036D5CE0|nr:AI-2E family transporter [Algicola sagamiensis]
MRLNIEHTATSRLLIILASIVILLAGIKTASSILVPFLLSIFIAISCNPAIKMLMNWRISRGISITLVMIVIILFGMWLAQLVGNSLNDFTASIPEYRQTLKTQFVSLTQFLEKYNIHIDFTQLSQYFDPGEAMSLAATMLSNFSSVMANVFFILLTVIFMLLESGGMRQKVHVALADPDMKMMHIDKFLESVNSYLAIKTVVSIVTGGIVSLMLWILDIDYFLLWGVVAFLFNYVPNIGSIVAAVPAVLLGLVLHGPLIAGITAAGYIAINTVVGNVVEPKLMGRGLGLSTLVVFLSLVFWGWLLGTVGMLLSVPLTMIVKIALEASEETRWIGVLLSGDAQEPKIAEEAVEGQ